MDILSVGLECILAVMAGLMSVLGPKYLPNTSLSSGYRTTVSLNLIQLYQLNSANSEISAVSPVSVVSGVSPLRPKQGMVAGQRGTVPATNAGFCRCPPGQRIALQRLVSDIVVVEIT